MHFLSTKKVTESDHIINLKKALRDSIDYEYLIPNLPKEGDHEWKKILKRFKHLHEDTKSTAIKSRMLIKQKLFIMMMRVIVAIRKLKYDHKNKMKADRAKAYLQEKRSLTKEDLASNSKSFTKKKDPLNNSFVKVGH